MFYGKQLNHPKEKARKVGGSYIIEVDISDNKDISVLTVSRLDGPTITVINSFTGVEAEHMYEQLTNQKVEVIRDE